MSRVKKVINDKDLGSIWDPLILLKLKTFYWKYYK